MTLRAGLVMRCLLPVNLVIGYKRITGREREGRERGGEREGERVCGGM